MHHIKQSKKITYRRWRYGRGGIPCLIVEGYFLQNFGFHLGQHVQIRYEKDKITISNAKELNQLLAETSKP